MPANHPEYGVEKQKLDDVIAYIEQQLAKRRVPSMAADSRTAVAISNVRLNKRTDLIGARVDPFFARVDAYLEDTPVAGPPEVFYLGYCEMMDKRVYSWADDSPLVRLYHRPRGEGQAYAHLARAISIAHDDITAIYDRYVHSDRAGEPIEADRNAHLRETLNQTKSGQLRDIVPSLEPEQYDLIAAPADRMLLVQGSPGSGKTEIALHRVAWLLHQAGKQDRSRQQVLVLGPSPIFMRYISRVLPDLGWHDVHQSTFGQWVLDQFSNELDVATMGDSLECLLDETTPRAVRAQHHLAMRIKGSLAMGAILDAYVTELTGLIEDRIEPLSATISLRGHEPIQVQVSRERLISAMRETSAHPLNRRKHYVAQRLANALTYQLGDPNMESSTRDDLRRQLFAVVQRHLRQWRALNTRSAYRDLVSDGRLLHRLAHGLLSATECEMVSIGGPDLGHNWAFCDLAPLLYLDQALNGVSGETYAHVVVDEAQDVPPLLFRCLASRMNKNAIIAVGDPHQGVYAPMGIASWKDVAQAAGLGEPDVASLTTSYRTTRQITEYANLVLSRLGVDDAHLADSFDRPGRPVIHHQCENREHQAETIAGLVCQASQGPAQSTAVICKTASQAELLTSELQALGLENCAFLTSQTQLTEGATAIVASYACKGMEFDRAIIADADAATFDLNLRDGRLLYVAITRAAHELDICWCGVISPLLANGRIKRDDPLDLTADAESTIDAYAAKSNADANALVRKLATDDRLWLMGDGMINETLLALSSLEGELADE